MLDSELETIAIGEPVRVRRESAEMAKHQDDGSDRHLPDHVPPAPPSHAEPASDGYPKCERLRDLEVRDSVRVGAPFGPAEQFEMH